MYNEPLVFQLWENPQKKSPMKRRCAIISCSQNINQINSRSQKPFTALVPDNKPITKFNMLEIPPPPFSNADLESIHNYMGEQHCVH
jgi:hypothetical protein